MPAAAPARSFEIACAENRWAEAEAIARRELSRKGGAHAWAVTALVRCALQRGDRDEMRLWLDRAARIATRNRDLTDFLASMLLAAGDSPAALEQLEQGEAEDPAARLLGGTVRALAWRLAGRIEDSAALTEALLRRHAVPPDAPLTGLAERLAADLGRPGWMACPGGSALTGTLRAGREIRLEGPDSQCWSAETFHARFGSPRFVLPVERTGPWTLLADGQPLLGGGLSLIGRRVDGIVEIEGRQVTGWAASPDDPRPLPIVLKDWAGTELELAAVRETDQDGKPRFTFAADLGKSALASGRLTVTAGGVKLAGSPIAWRRKGGDEIHPIRAVPRRKQPARPAGDPVIDVVIPVHGGRAVTLACLDRVLAHTPRGEAEIVVIDDASPDAALAAALDALAAEGRITLIRLETNQGFPAAVNRGMALHKKRDVVLLNSDASVPREWLRRLKAAAYGAPDTGTVTALSNEASICSYGPDDPKEWPALDRLAAEVNRGVTVELPTAIGFCMYIRRDCLAETGLFSETLFGRGYGEENDFCLRARRRGWRHVAAADVLAGHVGGASFGPARALLQARNLKVLERLHPGYQKLVARFSAADPLAPARRALDLGRWRRSDGRPATLLITLGLEGGASRHVEERRQALADQGRRALLLAPAAARREGRQEILRCRLADPERPELRDLLFDSEAEFERLAALLAEVPVTAVEIHHSLKHHPAVLGLPERLSVPYEMVLHDYHWLCPRVALVDGTGRYCGEPQPSLPHCEACRLEFGSESGEDITVEALRRRSGRLLTGARRVVAPSRDVAERYRRYFPQVAAEVVPWDRVAPPSDHRSPPHHLREPFFPSPLVGEGGARLREGEGVMPKRRCPSPAASPSPSPAAAASAPYPPTARA
jgi:GT2 family glycosyltransferase